MGYKVRKTEEGSRRYPDLPGDKKTGYQGPAVPGARDAGAAS